MKKNKTTIYSVANKAQVSLATVSRVLNYPEKVKEETRKRVLEVIEELDYRPNAIARGLASRKSTFIGIIVPDFSRGSVAEAINGICKLANSYGYQIMVFPAEGENRVAKDVWSDVIASQVDGVLYLNDLLIEEDLDHIKKMNIPVVIASNVVDDSEIASVNVDYYDAAYTITKLLIDRGRKDILFATTARIYSMNNEKERGYLAAIEEAGLNPRILKTSGKPKLNKPVINEYLDNNKIDAVVAVRDSIAVSVMNIAIDRGYEVPNKLEVYGFQNTRAALLSRPQLSTIDSPTYEIGKVAMEMLTVMMEDDNVKEMKVLVPYGIVERGTTKTK
ncbi:LacI family DNA-binding transcriptional regulator [Mycoplasmatota bacterium]|nr:LacI family DNA-binding transcriptional regulator [Mycoplasmatota bacterium]